MTINKMARRLHRTNLYDAMSQNITPISKGLDDARRKGATCHQTKKLSRKMRQVEQRLTDMYRSYQNDQSVKEDLIETFSKLRRLQLKMCSVRKHHTSNRASDWVNDMGILNLKKSLIKK